MPAANLKRTNTILYCQNWENTVRFYHDALRFLINHELEYFVEFQPVGNIYLSIAHEANKAIKSADGASITLSW